MIKLYNYDKNTLKFKRIIELEKMPDNSEFCTLEKIPGYDDKKEYLTYDIKKDSWIINQIEIPEIDLEHEKVIQIIDLKAQLDSLDFKTIKFVQGKITKEEFETIKVKCQELRDEINKIKGSLK